MPRPAMWVGAALTLAVGFVGPSGPAAAGDENGRIMVRILSAVDIPEADETVLVNGTKVVGAKSDISVDSGPAAAFNYFLTRNLALELFCCLSHHEIEGAGTISSLRKVADTWIFTPALTLQYHFDGLGALKPYVGAGVQYFHFFDIDTGENVLGATSIEIDDSVGLVLQAGLNLSVGRGLFLNAEVRRVWTETTTTWRNASLLGGTDVTGDSELESWVVSAGMGYRFNFSDLFGDHVASQ